MNGERILRGVGAITLLTALAIPFVFINALSPIVHDLWGAVGRFDSLADPFEAYVSTYQNGNPRLGSMALYFAGISLPARVLVQFASVAALTMAAFTIISGRTFRPIFL